MWKVQFHYNVQGSFFAATFVSMLTEGQVFVLNPGQTLDISCEFEMDNLNMFETPFVWKKHQRHEEMQVNILGNIMPPFLATNRFESTLEGTPPRYCLRLRIKSKHSAPLFNQSSLINALS